MNLARLLAAGLPPETARGLPSGSAFGAYTLIEEIGRGAMGVVFTAQQPGANRIVAIKFAHGSHAGSAEAMRRFRTEAEAVAALDHAGILPIYEVGEEGGVAYYTMRFAEAGSLAERLEWFREPRAAAALVARVAEAVQHAHARGILHRDLKPGNILLASRTEPLVADFGLARWMQRDSDLTASRSVLGTPEYLAPEMLRGAREGSTIAADIFSLGAILYHLLAGRAPFAGEHVGEVLRNVDECAPPMLEGVPRDLAAVCHRCLERAPAARYTSADALGADLRAWLEGRVVAARAVGPAGQFVRWARRKPLLAGLLAALLVALAALIGNIVLARGHALAIEQRRAATAEQFAREQRRTALLARAQLRLHSHDAGRRLETLRLLREAWPLGPSAEIRTAAITALTLPDAEERTLPPGTAFEPATPGPENLVPLPSRVVASAWHPGDRRLAVAGEDKIIYLLDPDRRTIVRRWRGLESDCRALAFSPDGEWLASVSSDETVRLWEARSGDELLVITRRAPGADFQLRWSRDGAWLAVSPTRAFHLTRPTVTRLFQVGTPDTRAEENCTIDLSADGRWLVTVTESGTRLWDARTRREAALFPKKGNEWSAARFSPDSRQLWLGGWNSDLRLVELPVAAGAPLPEPQWITEFEGSLFHQSGDGAWLIALSNDGGGFQFVAAAPPHRAAWLRHAHPLCLALTPDARVAATSSFDAPRVQLWDFANLRPLRTLPTETAAQLALAPDGRTLLTGTAEVLEFWNVASGARLSGAGLGSRIEALACDPAGRLFAVETRASLILFRLAETGGEELARLRVMPDAGTASFCFSRDSRQLAVQTPAGGALVWQLDLLHRELRALGMAW